MSKAAVQADREELRQLDLSTIRFDVQHVQQLRKLFSQESTEADRHKTQPRTDAAAQPSSSKVPKASTAPGDLETSVKVSERIEAFDSAARAAQRGTGAKPPLAPKLAPRPEPSAAEMPKSLAGIFAAGGNTKQPPDTASTPSLPDAQARPTTAPRPAPSRPSGTVSSMPNETLGAQRTVVPSSRPTTLAGGRAQSLSLDYSSGVSSASSNARAPSSNLLSLNSTQRSKTSQDSSIDMEDDVDLPISCLRLDASVSKRSAMSSTSASTQSSDHVIDMSGVESSSTNSAPATTYVRNPNANIAQRKKNAAVNSAVTNVTNRFSRFMRKFMRDANADEEERQAKLRNIRVNNLPMKFLAKYLGMRICHNEVDPTNVPVEILLEEAAKMRSDEDLTLVVLTVSEEGLQMTEHPENCGPRVKNNLYPVNFISFAVQDLLYERVVSIIFIAELSARMPKTECHSFLCSNAFAARSLALSLQLAFQKLVERLNGNKVPLELRLDESGDSASTSSRFGTDVDA